MTSKTITIGSRGSQLALYQSQVVAKLIESTFGNITTKIKVISTRGDKIIDKPLPEIGGKGLFTQELESELYSGDIDIAVHSLKDLPTNDPQGLSIAAVLKRHYYQDAIISKNKVPLSKLPKGSVVATSSLRRSSQILRKYPRLKIANIRGNIGTRIDKILAKDSDYDALVVALAAVKRLSLDEFITQILPTKIMLPAPGQGAIAICSKKDFLLDIFAKITDKATLIEVSAERAFLNHLGGGCSLPIACLAQYQNNTLEIIGQVTSVSGKEQISLSIKSSLTGDKIAASKQLGKDMAKEAIVQGALSLLKK